MNRLMFNLGRNFRYMAEEGGEGGAGGGAPSPAAGGEGAPAAGGEGAPEGGAKGANGDPSPEGAPAPAAGGEAKPFLGNTPAAEGDGAQAAKDPAKGGEGGEAPKQEADYLNALVKDEKILGNDKSLQLDKDLLKSCVPVMQKYGVSPEAANELANALAKAQMDQALEASKERVAYFEKMKAASIQKYTQKDFETINAGIDKWFKPNGVMNNVIRNSELGADPEFLALMHHLGQAAKQDGLAGAGAGGGGSSANPDSTDGLSKLW